MAARLESLGLVKVERLYAELRPDDVVRLTGDGHAKVAAMSFGREHAPFHRDDVQAVYMAKLLWAVDLYLAMVADGAKDWPEVKNRAQGFSWFSANEKTTFEWKQPGEFNRPKLRRVMPIATIENATSRYLVEVFWHQRLIDNFLYDVNNYCHIFSIVRASGNNPAAYYQRYLDDLKPVVVFLFSNEKLAKQGAAIIEKRSKEMNFYIPAWRCGTVDSLARELGKELAVAPLAQALPSREALQAHNERLTKTLGNFRDEVRKYVNHIVFDDRRLSSLYWPSNWKTVMRYLYPPEQWAKLEAECDFRVKNAQSIAKMTAQIVDAKENGP